MEICLSTWPARRAMWRWPVSFWTWRVALSRRNTGRHALGQPSVLQCAACVLPTQLMRPSFISFTETQPVYNIKALELFSVQDLHFFKQLYDLKTYMYMYIISCMAFFLCHQKQGRRHGHPLRCQESGCHLPGYDEVAHGHVQRALKTGPPRCSCTAQQVQCKQHLILFFYHASDWH